LDPYGRIAASGGKWKSSFETHFFLVEQEGQFSVLTPSGGRKPETETYLGTELDATLGLQVAENFGLEFGGSVFLPGAVLDNQGLEDTAKWGYAQTVFTF